MPTAACQQLERQLTELQASSAAAAAADAERLRLCDDNARYAERILRDQLAKARSTASEQSARAAAEASGCEAAMAELAEHKASSARAAAAAAKRVTKLQQTARTAHGLQKQLAASQAQAKSQAAKASAEQAARSSALAQMAEQCIDHKRAAEAASQRLNQLQQATEAEKCSLRARVAELQAQAAKASAEQASRQDTSRSEQDQIAQLQIQLESEKIRRQAALDELADQHSLHRRAAEAADEERIRRLRESQSLETHTLQGQIAVLQAQLKAAKASTQPAAKQAAGASEQRQIVELQAKLQAEKVSKQAALAQLAEQREDSKQAAERISQLQAEASEARALHRQNAWLQKQLDSEKDNWRAATAQLAQEQDEADQAAAAAAKHAKRNRSLRHGLKRKIRRARAETEAARNEADVADARSKDLSSQLAEQKALVARLQAEAQAADLIQQQQAQLDREATPAAGLSARKQVRSPCR